MATKAKSPDPVKTASSDTFEARFAAALACYAEGKAAKGKALLEDLLKETTQPDRVRAIRIRLQALSPEPTAKEEPTLANALGRATLYLNAHRPQEALKALEQDPHDRPQRDYLRATALVQLERYTEAAEALKRAIAQDPAWACVARLEPDFKAARQHPAFQNLG